MTRPAPARSTRQSRASARQVQEQSAPLTGGAATTIAPVLKRPLLAVIRFIEKHDHAPTVRELAELLDQEESGTNKQVRRLIEAGYLKRTSRAWRDLQVTPLGRKVE